MANGLTLKQQAFISAYLGDSHGNAADAARRAGYAGTPESMRATGYDVLTNAHVAAAIAAAHEAIAKQGIASKQNRVNAYDKRWQLLHRVVESRSEEYATEAPGSDTGLLVRTYKMLGAGPLARTVEEWSVDTGLLGEMRQLEQQVAKEMGQWTEQQELSGDLTLRRYIGVDPEEV